MSGIVSSFDTFKSELENKLASVTTKQDIDSITLLLNVLNDHYKSSSYTDPLRWFRETNMVTEQDGLYDVCRKGEDVLFVVRFDRGPLKAYTDLFDTLAKQAHEKYGEPNADGSWKMYSTTQSPVYITNKPKKIIGIKASK